MSRRRGAVLVLVHLLMVGHVVQWWITGRTLSPIEPSETMYTLNEGHLNAGFIFFLAAIAVTLVFGRFVCGWGCHFIFYQDLCTWFLKRMGIKPKGLQSRVLILGPVSLGIYMFVWPTVYRWWMGVPAPTLTNDLMTADFWKTFPGPMVAILTVAVCGFSIVYFLGSKGFCTYACPYGGVFGLADKAALWRIRVTDACEHCGHCTATCTSNVRVHDEVARYGMVVDPGCMKCMDCVSVCPNDALYVGVGWPAVGAKPTSDKRVTRPDYTGLQEIALGLVALAAFLVFRGLYGLVPMLMAMGLAAMTAFVTAKLSALMFSANVRFQSLQLKRGRRLTTAGRLFSLLAGGWVLFSLHSAVVHYCGWRGSSLMRQLALPDDVWRPGDTWWDGASAEDRRKLEAAGLLLGRADSWALARSGDVMTHRVWFSLAMGNDAEAESIVRRIIDLTPERPDAYRSLAALDRKAGQTGEAIRDYQRSLEVDPTFAPSRSELAALLVSEDRVDDAIDLLRDGARVMADDVTWPMQLARLFLQRGRLAESAAVLQEVLESEPLGAGAAAGARAPVYLLLSVVQTNEGRTEQAMQSLRQAIELAPDMADAHYNLALVHVHRREVEQAITHFKAAVAISPTKADYHYNLGVAVFMDGRPADALVHVERALELNPDDPDAIGFSAFVKQVLNETAEPEQP